MSTEYTKDVIRDLVAGRLPWEMVKNMMSNPKDKNRLKLLLEIEQERVPWDEKIILPLAEHLYIVEKGGTHIVKATCGYEFGDYRDNWKEKAIIYVRDTLESLREIYVGPRAGDPEKMVLREFYCPECGELLEVDAVAPGYPILNKFIPDLETLYNEWLD